MHSGRQQTVRKRAKFLIKNATKQKQSTKADCCPARVCVCVCECVVRISESTCVRLYWFTHIYVCVCVRIGCEIQKRFRSGSSNSKT